MVFITIGRVKNRFFVSTSPRTGSDVSDLHSGPEDRSLRCKDWWFGPFKGVH